MAQYDGLSIKHVRYNDCPDDYISATVHHSADDSRLVVTLGSDNDIQHLVGVNISTLKFLVAEAEKYASYTQLPSQIGKSSDTVKEYTPDGKVTFEVTLTTSDYTTTEYQSYVVDPKTGCLVEAECAEGVAILDCKDKAIVVFDTILDKISSEKHLYIEGEFSEILDLGTNTFLELFRVYPNNKRCLVQVSTF